MKLYPIVHKWYEHRVHTARDHLTPVPIEVYVLRFPTEEEQQSAKERGVKTVCYMACEPNLYKEIYICEKDAETIIPASAYVSFLKANCDKVDYIFDYNEELTKTVPNCIHTLSGYSFINPKTSLEYKGIDKLFGVSFVSTSKADSANQQLRHIIWNDQESICIPRFFLNSGRDPMPNDFAAPKLGKDDNEKSKLFKSMFSIVVENSIEKDYFTEKLIDCFATKTVPIYLGCPNISDYFDTNGIIFARNEAEIIRICNNLLPENYTERLESINTNYRLAQPYLVNLTGRILQAVKQNLFPCFVFDAF